MINFLETLSNFSCKGTKLFPLFQAAKFMIILIQIAVPFGLVIWGSLDWFKALIAGDEKEMRMKRKPFFQRVLAAIIILFLPWIVQLIAKGFAGKATTANFWVCYSEAKPVIDFSSWQNQSIGNGGVIGGSSGAGVNSTKTNAPKVITGTSKSGQSSDTNGNTSINQQVDKALNGSGYGNEEVTTEDMDEIEDMVSNDDFVTVTTTTSSGTTKKTTTKKSTTKKTKSKSTSKSINATATSDIYVDDSDTNQNAIN